MQLITKSYLTSVIFRAIHETLDTRRASQKNILFYLNYPSSTNEEFMDFIQSCPFYDLGLKEYLLKNNNEQSIIISQHWETAFIVKSREWARSCGWLHVDVILSIGFYSALLNSHPNCLKLPY